MDNQMFITLGRLRKVTNNLSEQPDSMKLTFEFILTAFFPKAWQNIQDEINRQYTLGYLAGKEEKNES